MFSLDLTGSSTSGIGMDQIAYAVQSLLDSQPQLKKVLLIGPDYTRFHSGGGFIANQFYHALHPGVKVDLLIALGTHVAMTPGECQRMYGDIPYSSIQMHDWRTQTVRLGRVPAEYVGMVSDGIYAQGIDVEVNSLLFDHYDLIVSIGQVVPHEVVGMANHSKNIFVGCGGASMINSSHILGAFYGMERMMGRDKTPVRLVFDYASERYLADLPILYIQTVTTAEGEGIHFHGLFMGQGRAPYEKAVELARSTNFTILDRPIDKAVVMLDEVEFKTTWLGNKSIYRTRMAMADGGQLIVLAPGVAGFGEDREIDALIRKYGYAGRENIIRYTQQHDDLKANLSAAAHMIHGSSDGRFSVTYCTRYLSRSDVEKVHFQYMPYDEAVRRYDPQTLGAGYNLLPDKQEVFYIPNPALGLWAYRKRLEEQI